MVTAVGIDDNDGFGWAWLTIVVRGRPLFSVRTFRWSIILAKKELKVISAVFRGGKLMDETIQEAARDAIRAHKEQGLPLAAWRNGETTWISAEEAERVLASECSK